MLTHAPWDAVPGLRHGFLDAADCAAAEWETVLARVGVRSPLALPRQVHGARAVSAVSAAARPEADALATATPGLLVGVVTADCMPALLVDRRRGSRRHLDLRIAARCLLEAAGVGSVAVLGPCTACGPGYHSYRRDGARTGRQLSFDGWE